MVFLSIFSPIILIIFITFLSFVFQNFKGLIYLGYILAAAIVRYYIYYINGATPLVPNGTVCTAVQYSKYGNITFSVFVFSFTLMYLFLPMFINGHANYWIFSALLAYGFLDIFVKFNNKCYSGASEVLLNSLFGLVMAAAFVMAMYAGNASKYLFFNEMNTGTDTCSRPANQQFKCKVYKNGELVGNTTM